MLVVSQVFSSMFGSIILHEAPYNYYNSPYLPFYGAALDVRSATG